MKKTVTMLLALVLILSLVAGCAPQNVPASPEATAEQPSSNGTPAEQPSTEQPAQNKGKIAFITGTGGLGDKNLNDFTFSGAQAHEKDGVTVDVVQPKGASDFPSLQRLYAEAGDYATIVCVGFDQLDALSQVAPEFPDQNFMLCDTTLDLPNVTSVLFRAEETGFQLGIIAGMLAKENSLPNARGKNTIGFVGGMDIATINMFASGYIAGAKLVNPDVTVLRAYVGSFGDPSKGTELAPGLYEQGADIVFACAGGSGLGVFTAAEKSNGYALGIETNQNVLSPDHVIASGTRDWGKAIYNATTEALNGTIKGGVMSFGIIDGALKAEREGSNVKVSDEIMAKVDELSAKVADGSLVLPNTLDAIDAFVAKNVG